MVKCKGFLVKYLRKTFRLASPVGYACLLLPAMSLAHQTPAPSPSLGRGTYDGGVLMGTESLYGYATVEVDIHGPNGVVVDVPVYVSLVRNTGQVFKSALAEKGKVVFAQVPKSELTAQVVASGYETAKQQFQMLDKLEVKVQVNLQPIADKEVAAADRGIAALNPKAQKNVGKALQALQANRPADARDHLIAAEKEAPESAEVEYLFGVYASRMNNAVEAQTHWQKALQLDPRNLSALLAVSQQLLQERKAPEAVPYLARALETDPSSWRAHMLMAQADLFQDQNEDAVKQAERAMELGQERAATVQPILSHALYRTGQKDRAIQGLQVYVKNNPTDTNAKALLERFLAPPAATPAAVTETADAAAGAVLPVPSNWLPPDVDENVPPVESGTSCSIDEVEKRAGERATELVRNVDRFAATETLTHESINKYGMPGDHEKRKFDYTVSIQDLGKGYLGVTEFRDGAGGQAAFPDGVVTNGLPALALIFHPYYAGNYEMTCEGLARSNGQLAWQVHFRQRVGKPNVIKSYQIGMHGPSYPVALKGRAWIAADSYELVRMETDIVAPIPQIKLLAEHTDIEYGPVDFRKGNVTLWLPKSAEVYFAWRGRQVHRRHSFSNYMLFAVDDQQRIGTPKIVPTAPGETAKP